MKIWWFSTRNCATNRNQAQQIIITPLGIQVAPGIIQETKASSTCD
jgi:hypothetical protein